jgi:acyl-[acyl-carrier-protein] desaturase
MMPNTTVLHDLEPTVERLLERHLTSSKEWFPHEYVPYSRGRDHEPGETWSAADADLGGATIDDAVRSALLVNLLTEDNLPYYFRSVERMFGADGPWGTWVRRWTAEEGRHAMAIYGYLMVTRAIDPHELERGRMAQVSAGITPDPASLQRGFVYLALQELATRIAHRSTGRMIGDPAGYEVMMRVASDENLHQLFYRDLAEAALEHDPSGMMCAIEQEVAGFQMPGIGIPDFNRHAALIARAGIYDLAVHHEQILVPVVLRQWDVENVTGLDADGEQARERLMKRVGSDENLHQLFYRDLAAAAIQADPNTMMIAMEKQVRNFAMPGTGIPDFDRHAALIAKAGIYDLQVHHEQILVPVVIRQWDAANISGLSGEGALAQERLMKRLATSEKVARRFADKRDAALVSA